MYCTVRDVRNALTPLGVSSDQSTAASLADWQLIDAIREAEGTVNTYLGDIYQIDEVEFTEDTDGETPDETFMAAPYPVRSWTRNIAAFLATLTFKRNQDVSEDDPVRLRYNHAMSMLDKVAEGSLVLPLEPAPGGASGSVVVVNQYEGTLFGPEDFQLAKATYQPLPGHWNP